MAVPSPHRDFAAEAQFDRRPGELEATRGLVDPRAPFMAWAEKHDGVWSIQLIINTLLSADAAFKLAAELGRLGELIEGRAEF